MVRKAFVFAALIVAYLITTPSAQAFNQDWGGMENDWAVSTYDGQGKWVPGMTACSAQKNCLSCAVDVNDKVICVKAWFGAMHCKCEIKEEVGSDVGYVRKCYTEGSCTYVGP